MQLGPNGAVLTVKRHLALTGSGLSIAVALRAIGRTHLSNVVFRLVGAAAFSVRFTIWLLMNWK